MVLTYSWGAKANDSSVESLQSVKLKKHGSSG